MFEKIINYIFDFFAQLFRTINQITKLINKYEVKRKWFVNIIDNSVEYYGESCGESYYSIRKNKDIFQCFEVNILLDNTIHESDLNTLLDNVLLGVYDKIINKIYKKKIKKIKKNVKNIQ